MKLLPSAKYSLEDCPGTLAPTLDYTPLQKPLMKIPPGKIALQQLKKRQKSLKFKIMKIKASDIRILQKSNRKCQN